MNISAKDWKPNSGSTERKVCLCFWTESREHPIRYRKPAYSARTAAVICGITLQMKRGISPASISCI